MLFLKSEDTEFLYIYRTIQVENILMFIGTCEKINMHSWSWCVQIYIWFTIWFEHLTDLFGDLATSCVKCIWLGLITLSLDLCRAFPAQMHELSFMHIYGQRVEAPGALIIDGTYSCTTSTKFSIFRTTEERRPLNGRYNKLIINDINISIGLWV